MPTIHKKICDFCKTYYEGYGSKFCSLKCSHSFFSGKRSPVWKNGITNSFRCLDCGIKVQMNQKICRKCNIQHKSKIFSGTNNPQYKGIITKCKCGRKVSKPVYDRCRDCFYKDISGSNNYNWKVGKKSEPYGIEFNSKLKEAIRKRDHYRCQQCFKHESKLKTKTNKSINLDIHHIDFIKRNNHPNNLITLCKSCHGRTQYKRNDWIIYLQDNIKRRIIRK